MIRLPFLGARRAPRRVASGFGCLAGRPFAETDSPAYGTRYERGAYRLQVRRAGYFAWEPLDGGRAFTDAVIDAEVEADAAAGVEFTLGLAKKPAAVTVNGETLGAFTYDAAAKTVRFSLPAGHSVVKIR